MLNILNCWGHLNYLGSFFLSLIFNELSLLFDFLLFHAMWASGMLIVNKKIYLFLSKNELVKLAASRNNVFLVINSHKCDSLITLQSYEIW